MIKYKTEKEIEIMKEAGKRLRAVVKALLPQVRVGMTTKEVDEEAQSLIKKEGGEPSFKKVEGYSWSTCLPINEQVVHTPPSSRILKNGDVLTVDIGLEYKGYNSDYATTFIVGKGNEKDSRFLRIGEQALYKAIDKAKAGNYLGQISQEIEKSIYGEGFFILKQLTGHGIGKKLHEDPYVLGYLDRPVEKTVKIKPGLVLAIEIIYSRGTEVISYEKDGGWSIKTSDNSLSACFEHTVAVLPEKTIVLT